MFQDVVDGGVIGRRAEEKIDKAGAGNLHPADLLRGRQRRDQLFGELAWFGARGLAKHHGQIAGKVAVAAIAGAFQIDGDIGVGRKIPPCLQGLNGGA